jgi:hypothetical protein
MGGGEKGQSGLKMVFWLILVLAVTPLLAQEPVRFSREVLPCCLTVPELPWRGCVGAMAGLRLDAREGAVAKVIVPGKPDESILLKRINEQNPCG